MIADIFYRAFDRFMREYDDFRIRRIKRSLKSCGERVYISSKCIIWGESGLELGDDIGINSFTHIFATGGVKIGDGTLISSNCSIASVTHPINSEKRFEEPNIEKPIIIGKNVWIGTGAIIVPGVTIGDHAIVGAGSIVTKDVQEKTIVVGNPAKFLRNVEI
jgi:acetyltransferase-like isoleucine patch superfamily enzyme